jgi:glycosyltransferase involved in cell wall biosynthesis
MVGEVENSRAFISSKNIMIVPLFSGSGIRVKILEAMAEGRTVISTTIGVEGIAAVNEKEILIADDADAFARQIKRCFKDPEFCSTIAASGRAFVKSRFNNKVIVKELLDFYKSLLT